MANNKSNNWKTAEKYSLILIIFLIVINAFWQKDSIIALISAICGIIYTFLAGKGLPICYLFGVTGSSFYAFLSYQNALWGNLLLYIAYYVPMQILGYFRWNKNLQNNKLEIIKISLPKKELIILVSILSLLSLLAFKVLLYFHDTHPLLDSITTIFSIGGMYLTVRRAVEQWIFWMIVNTISLFMWISVAMNGAKVYSTIIMWLVYLLLAIYFYILWKKEIKEKISI